MFANEDRGLSCVWTQMIYLLCVGCKVHCFGDTASAVISCGIRCKHEIALIKYSQTCPRQVKMLPISAQGHNWLVK